MKLPLNRRLALCLGFALVASVGAVASPARAEDGTSGRCIPLISTTPGIEVDLDDDGDPDIRAPRIYDVYMCVDADLDTSVHPPKFDNCSPDPKVLTCFTVHVTVLPAYASASGEVQVCYTIEGWWPECSSGAVPGIDWSEPETICIGVDLEGGSPCGSIT